MQRYLFALTSSGGCERENVGLMCAQGIEIGPAIVRQMFTAVPFVERSNVLSQPIRNLLVPRHSRRNCSILIPRNFISTRFTAACLSAFDVIGRHRLQQELRKISNST